MIPGPSSMLALTQGARYGWTAGILSGLGNVAASVTQGIISFFAIYQLGELSVISLQVIKYIGAIYIIYLGFSLFKVESFDADPDTMTKSHSENLLKYFSDGFVFAIFNPKALTFFAAIFPQFANGSSTSTSLMIAIFTPIAVIAFMCFIFYVFAGKLIMNLFNKTRHIGKLFGGLIVLSGVLFLLS
jgi:homoserine/homoserine lactone efflux protein